MKSILYILVLVITLIQCKQKEESQLEAPNIVFFLIDDQRHDLISHAGHPIVKTPTVDKLAKDGYWFKNAFVTTSICAASRASIITGAYESKHNYTFGTEPLSEDLVTSSYPYLLRQSGYHTGFIGKFGIKLENKDSLIGEMFDYYEASPLNYPHFVEQPDGTLRHTAEVYGDRAIDFINHRGTEKPFCLSISFNSVHAVDNNKEPGLDGHFPYPKAVAHMYEDIAMPEPALSDSSIYNNHPDFLKTSLNRERYFWRWDTPEKYQANMRAYLRMISGYDNVMNRVISELEKNGLDKNTIIIYSADNGYYMGNRGFAGKWSHYEESLRVPFIIYDPRMPKEATGKTIDEMVLNIDIPATILDYAGLAQPKVYQGNSVIPLLHQKNKSWRNNFLCEHRMNHDKIPKYVGIHGQRFVYANYYEQDPPYEYLHDLQNDPNQLKNLASDPDYKSTLLDLRKKCRELESRIMN